MKAKETLRDKTIAQFDRLVGRYPRMKVAVVEAVHRALSTPGWDGSARLVKEWIICRRCESQRRIKTTAAFDRLTARYPQMEAAVAEAVHKASKTPGWDGSARLVKDWIVCRRYESRRRTTVEHIITHEGGTSRIDDYHDALCSLLASPKWHGEEWVVHLRAKRQRLSNHRKEQHRTYLMRSRGGSLVHGSTAVGEPHLNRRIEAALDLQLISAMNSLNDRDRQVLALSCLGHSARDIGCITGQSEEAVRATLYRARKRIRKRFEH